MSKKKEKDRQPPPVITGYDERCRQRSKGNDSSNQSSSAPDGISGNWS